MHPIAFHWSWLFTASYGAWIAMEAWIFSRDRRVATGDRADRGSIRVIMLVLAVSITAAWYAMFTMRGLRIAAFRFPLFLFGTGLMWAGMALRLWAVLTLGKFFRTTVFVQDEHRLVTAGPYRLLRHPAYTGTLLTMLGLGLALGNWLSAAILLAGFVIAYGYRIRTEENALKQRFGQAYSAYAGQRWLLLPFVC